MSQQFANTEDYGFQVDIASTLALLFGVPIPGNNVGTVMLEVFESLEGFIFTISFCCL